MKFFHSIRWRLQLWHSLLLVVVLVGFGFTAWRLQRTTQFERVDKELERRIAAITGTLRREGGIPGRHPQDRPPQDGPEQDRPLPQDRPEFDNLPPRPFEVRLSAREMNLFEDTTSNAFYYVVWSRGDHQNSHSATAPADVPHPERSAQPRDSRLRGTLRERYHFTPPGECILVGRDVRAELAEARRFAWLLAGAGGFVLLLGLAGGAWLVALTLRPIRDISSAARKIATGDLTQRISTADTESELGQLAAVLNSTFARLDAAFTQQTRFTADAAHELRTPVTVMLTHTQNGLQSECPNAEHREAFEASQRAAQRMRRLIGLLLELSRLDAGQEPLCRKDCDLSVLVAESIELVRPLAAKRSIQIHSELNPATCHGDPERLAQVLTNLLSNAIDYNCDGGAVQVALRCEDANTVLTISNTGPGISAEDVPHIFERFRRADKSRSGAAGHCGLGLAIAKAIVDAHSGSITVQSEPGKQTTFTVKLPQ